MTAAFGSAAAATHPCRLRTFARPAPDVPRLWFLMLTYNAREYTKRCLLSLDRTTPHPWRALILDNGSTDGTREWLSTLRDPRIRVEFAERNLGVAGGRNRQLALLGDEPADDSLLVFVDNDLEFFGDWTRPLVAPFDADPWLGIASASGYEIIVRGNRRELLPRFDAEPQLADVAAGGFACCVRPAVFAEIGGFDEALSPFWHEDDDLSVRARAAGWSVLAVPSPGIIHHGHKSGSALPDLSRGGSEEKQRYLVDKWRRAGIVTASGRLAFGRPTPDAALRARLGTALARPEPLTHSELSRARADVGALHRAWEADGTIDAASPYASAPARALLGDEAAGSATGLARHAIVSLADAIDALKTARRRLVRLETSHGAAPSASLVLADPQAWDDDTWFRHAVERVGNGAGREQWFARDVATWRAAEAAAQLERTIGPAGAGQHVLFVGSLRERLVWGLAAAGVRVTVADLPPSPSVDPVAWAASPERASWRAVAAGRVRRMPLDQAAAVLADDPCEAVVHLPWTEPLAPDTLFELLTAVAPGAAAGAPFIAFLPTRLGGPPAPGLLAGPRQLPPLLARHGFAPFDASSTLTLSDDALLAATTPAVPHRTPDFLVADGRRLSGHLGFVARHA